MTGLDRLIRPDQLAALRAIASGVRTEVQRTRLRWLVDNGWLRTEPIGCAPGYRVVTLPEQTWSALGVAGDPTKLYTIRLQLGGYRSDTAKKAGRL